MKISCIVPVYNEGPRVIAVLDALIDSKLLDEIIVVNDGSTDDTKSLLDSKPGIKLISYENNRGKSHAVKTGLEAAQNNLVMMIDSDLVGLNAKIISDLAEPVISGKADMTLSLRQNSLWLYRFLGLDFVSGERVFNKQIISQLEDLDNLPGFALESYLNQIVITKKLRLCVIDCLGLVSPRKSAKQGRWTGAKGDIKMVRQIVRYLGWFGTIRNFYRLRQLKIKNRR